MQPMDIYEPHADIALGEWLEDYERDVMSEDEDELHELQQAYRK